MLSFGEVPGQAGLPRSYLKPGYWRCTQDVPDDLIFEDAVLAVVQHTLCKGTPKGLSNSRLEPPEAQEIVSLPK